MRLMPGSIALVEELERRQFLSAAADIGLLEEFAPQGRARPIVAMAVKKAPVLPNLVRTYVGTYSDDVGVVATFKLVIRKQASRGSYASLRGTITAVVKEAGTINGDITYGKARASNLRVDLVCQGTAKGSPYQLTISGKCSASGSQIKGNFTFVNKAIGNASGPFLVKKVSR